MAISTNGTVLARLAGGLYNQTLSNATYAEVNAVVKTAADINTLANDLYARDFASKTDLSVATTLLSNLGLSSVTGLANWVAAQLTAAGSANKGAKIVSMLNDFSNLTSDATYGAAATSFNTKTTAALTLSQKDGAVGGDFNAAATIAAADAAAAAAAAAAKAAADAAAAKAAADAAAAKAAADAAAAAAAVKAAADAAAAKAAADAAAAAKAAADAAAVQAAADAAAKAAADAAAAAEKAPQTFTLTTGANSFTGKSGNDTFDGALNSTGAQTLTSIDSLDGGAGTDTLVATIAGTSSYSPTLSNIEKLVTTFTGAGTLNMSNATGVTSIEVTGSSATANFTNIPFASTLSLNVNGATDQSVGFDFKDTSVVGTTDAITLTVTDLVKSGTAGTITTTGIETVNIVSNGDSNTFTLADADATVINVSGAGALNLGTVPTTATTVNASASTGGVTAAAPSTSTSAFTITGGSGNDSLNGAGGNDVIVGGAGNDTITAGAGNDNLSSVSGTNTFKFVTSGDLTADDTVTGGSGTDTLSVVAGDVTGLSSTAKLTNVSGIERITVTDSLTASLTAAYVQAGISQVTLTSGSNGGTVVMEAGAKTLALGTANGSSGLTVTDTGIATTDSLTITSKTGVTTGADSFGGYALSVNGYESVTINTGTYASGQTATTVTITGDSAATGLPTPATLTLTGSSGLTTSGAIQLSSSATAAGIINASAMTGGLVMGAAAVGVTSIVGGTGNDTLKGTTGNSVLTSTIDGGAGNDAITGGQYNDSILGGDGDDTITGSAGNDYISAGAGTDRLSFTTTTFAAVQTVDGGDGTDTLYFTDTSGTVGDAAFANKTSIETISSASSGRVQVELGPLSTAAGVKTVTFAGTSSGGTADSLTVPATFTGSTLAVSLGTAVAADTTTVSAAAYTGALTVTASSNTQFLTATTKPTITGGTGTADKINLVAATYLANAFANVSGIENITITNASTPVSATIPLSSGNSSSGKTLTINGSAIVDSALSLIVDGTNINAGQLIVTGSTGADSIVGSASTTAGDSLVGGTGNDIFQFAAGNLASTDTVSGGDGTDVLTISDAGTLTDSQFTNIASVETLNFGNNNETITLGALAAATGIVTVTDGTGATTLNVGSGFTNNLTVALSSGTDTVSAGTYTGNLTVTVAASSSIDSTDTVTAGTGTADTLRVTFVSSGGLSSSNLAGYTGFETIKSYTDDTTGTIVLDNANIASGASLTADFTANATTVVTISAANETNGSVKILTGGGDDVITASVSTYGDSISAGSGNDRINIATAQLTSNDSIDGGSGTVDYISFSDAGTIADVAFSNVSNVEKIVLYSGVNTLVAGAEFQDAGAATIQGGTSNDAITIGSGVTRDVTVDLLTGAGGNDSVVATGYTGNLTVTTTEAGLTTNDTLTGGSGSDTLLVTILGSDALDATDLSKVTKFETIKTVGNVDATTITLSDANAVSSSITVNTTSVTTATYTITVDASAEDDSTLVYVGGGAKNVVTGTALGDTITGGSSNDTIYGGAGNDSISGGSGNDVLWGGTGVDTLTGGAGNDTFQINSTGFETGTLSPAVVYYGGVVASGTSVSTAGFDKITDFGAGDALYVGGQVASTTAGTNGVDLTWTDQAGLLRGTYSASANTFTFSTTGTDSIYAYDFDGSSTTNDIRAVVLVGYVDSGAADTMTSGLVGTA